MSRSCALLFFQTRLSRGRYVAQTTKAIKLLRELEKFGLIERKRRGQGKPSLVYVKNFSAESSKESVKNRDNDDSCGFKIACQDPAKSRCNKTKDLLIKVKSQNKKIR